jgi:hypothetical protein
VPSSAAEVIADVCSEFTQDGLSFELLSVDDETGVIDIGLAFTDIECEECVMPGDRLERLISTSLRARTNRGYGVRLHDPRSPAAARPAGIGGDATGGFITVLDPTATARPRDPDPGPDVGALRGKRVMIRVDALWRAWDWTVDEWTTQFEKAGATVVTWRRWQGLPGDEGNRKQAEYAALVQSSDVVISGLGNCGSCTAWTVRDALVGRIAGLPTITVVTEHFLPLARTLAADSHHDGLRMHVLPYPLDIRPEDEVRAIARDSFGALLVGLGAHQ